jgi:hypothetical protein
MKNADFNSIIKRLADELQDNLKITELVDKKVDELVNKVNSLRRENIALKEENEFLRSLVPTERLYNAFELIEIGFEDDSSLHGAESLINAANSHCSSYDDRSGYLPIDNVDKAIKYFEENGFKVRKMRLEC